MHGNQETFMDEVLSGMLAQSEQRVRFCFGNRWRKFKSCHTDQYLQGATSLGSLFLFVFRAFSGPSYISKGKLECSGM